MGRKVGITLEQVVETAAAIADRDGLEGLSLASVAGALGIRTPSLYNHVEGLPGLRRELAMHGGRMLGCAIDDAVRGGDAPEAALGSIAAAFRRFAREHPGVYAALLPAPKPEDDPELAAALAEPVAVVATVLVELGVDPDQAVPLIRALRASIHGFVDLELRGGFGLPEDIDSSFTTMVDLVIAAIVAQSRVRSSGVAGSSAGAPS